MSCQELDEIQEHVSYLEMQLVQAKVQWAQAEEDKDLAEFKAKELKKALAKGREINMQFAKRMTKLEVCIVMTRELVAGVGTSWMPLRVSRILCRIF